MKVTLATIACTLTLMAGLAWAEHPGVATSHRDAIQQAMLVHIKNISDHNGNGKYPVFDPESQTVVQLKLKEFHDSVELKGRTTPYFVSCADFTAENGTLYDLDFLVSRKYAVVGTLVHAKEGQHISYEIP